MNTGSDVMRDVMLFICVVLLFGIGEQLIDIKHALQTLNRDRIEVMHYVPATEPTTNWPILSYPGTCGQNGKIGTDVCPPDGTCTCEVP
jgi:hypothetical protein